MASRRARVSERRKKRAEHHPLRRAKRAPGETTDTALDVSRALQATRSAPASAVRHDTIITLQQTVGNSAVQRLMAQRTQQQRHRERKPGQQGLGPYQQVHQATSTGPEPVIQRQKRPAGAKEILPPDVMKELKAKIKERVNQLPVPELPPEDKVKKAVSEGESQGKEMEKVVKGKPAVAEFVAAQTTGGEGLKVAGGTTSATKTKTEESGGAGPARGRAKAEAKKKPAKAAKTRTGFRGMRRRAGMAETGALGQEVIGWAEQAVETGFQFAEIAGRTVANVLGSIFSAIGLLFNVVAGMLDVRAIISSAKRVYDLKKVLSEWRGKVKGKFPSTEEQELLDAVEYAIEQKYFKVFKRAMTLSAAVIGAGVAIAGLATGIALASNPVGWCILAGVGAVAAGIGLGVLFYKIGRAIWKWARGTKGKVRGDMAARLFDNAISGGGKLKGLAQKAIGALGLRWSKMEQEYKQVADERKPKVRKQAIALIMRKLASS